MAVRVARAGETPAAVAGSREPVVFRGLAAAWPALSRWTAAYLGGLVGDRSVEVVVGDREGYAPVFRSMGLAEFFARWQASVEGAALYLKEFDLFAALPSLAGDCDFSPLERAGARAWRYGWVSQAGGRTNLHHDLLDNTLTQIAGEKVVTLMPPACAPDVYPSPKFDAFARLSLVDAFAPDLARFPRYRAALAQERRVELVPGDAVYIPRGWWHTARSLSPSISLAGFWASRWDVASTIWPEELRLFLHQRGLYKRGVCTCHAPADGMAS